MGRKEAGFTLIELLVVIAIIAILAAILLPVLAAAQTRAKEIACVNNNKEIGVSITMYVADNGGFFPPLNSANFATHNPTNWWFEFINRGNYVSNYGVTNDVWRCPAVMPADILAATTSYYGEQCQGYGPFEDNTGTGVNCLIRYYLSTSGGVQGSQNVNMLKRVSQIWLVGDVGVPRSASFDTVNVFPSCGYTTELTVFQPVPGLGWTTDSPYKQAACRHNRRAVFAFCDGHVESWRWSELDTDYTDVFAEYSF